MSLAPPPLAASSHQALTCYAVRHVLSWLARNGPVNNALVARSLGVTSSDLEAVDKEDLLDAMSLSDDGDFEHIDMGSIEHCPTCLQLRPPAHDTATPIVAPVMAPAAVVATIAVVSPAPAAPVIAVDLTLAVHGRAAPDYVLLAMPDADKALLKSRLTPQDKLAMTYRQHAALNVDDVPIPIRDTNLPYADPLIANYMGPLGPAVHVKPAADDRWYAVQFGRGFTGVIRSWDWYKDVVPNIPGASGQSASGRAKAEFLWLTYYYRGQYGIVA